MERGCDTRIRLLCSLCLIVLLGLLYLLVAIEFNTDFLCQNLTQLASLGPNTFPKIILQPRTLPSGNYPQSATHRKRRHLDFQHASLKSVGWVEALWVSERREVLQRHHIRRHPWPWLRSGGTDEGWKKHSEWDPSNGRAGNCW